MKHYSVVTTIAITLVCCFGLSILTAQQPATVEAVTNEQENTIGSEDSESAIRKTIESYTLAFNRGDAKALANHWSVGGTFTTTTGTLLVGREQLEESFVNYFEKNKDAKLELPQTTISLLSPNVALETGVAWVVVPGNEPSPTDYKAFHIKTDEGWKIDSIQEQSATVPSSAHYEQLQSLEWMVGSWIDTDDQALVETNCRWTTNKNFLVKTFKVFIENRVDFEGTQVIGWDPHAGAIRSWTFDSDGGFGIGRWSEEASSWTVRTLNVLPDGRRGSSTNTYKLLDENTLEFRSVGRQVDGELLPSIEPIVVSRIQVN